MLIDLRKARPWFIFFTIAALCVILAIGLISYRYPLKYLDIIKKNSALYNMDSSLVCAVIHAESKFAERALSNKGARGLMQVTEGTADWMAEKMNLNEYSFEDIFDPKINIAIGCKYLSWLLQRYEDVDLAVAAYNAGSGNVDRWLKDPKYSDGQRLSYIPFKETRDYVKRVRINKSIYDVILKFGG